MKRLLLGASLLGAAAFLFGCPIYPSQNSEYRVCQGNGCYSCPDTSYSGSCIDWYCSTDSDCDSGYVCSDTGQCVLASSAPDSGSSDCSVTGCPDGYVCKLAGGSAQCVSLGGSSPDGGTEGGSTVGEGGTEGGDAADAGNLSGPCNADADCAGVGARCVDGTCTQRVDLCSDGTQCKAAGSSCVDGILRGDVLGVEPLPVRLWLRLHARRLQPEPGCLHRLGDGNLPGRRDLRGGPLRPAVRVDVRGRGRVRRGSGLRQRRLHS